MATEAGLLGTPTVRYADPDEPTMGEFEELRENDLLEQHNTMSDVVNAAERLLDNDEVVTRWATARDRYLTGTADLTALLVNIAEHVGDGVAVPADVSAHVA
jgi:predicted glycosyltransferase